VLRTYRQRGKELDRKEVKMTFGKGEENKGLQEESWKRKRETEGEGAWGGGESQKRLFPGTWTFVKERGREESKGSY